METCVGCGAVVERHPIVAVAALGDVGGDQVSVQNGFAAHPVCLSCWRDPEHRTRQKLKAHFFERNATSKALGAIGSNTIGG